MGDHQEWRMVEKVTYFPQRALQKEERSVTLVMMGTHIQPGRVQLDRLAAPHYP